MYAYVIMSTHLHLIASSDDLVKTLGSFKSYTAMRIIEQLIGSEDDRFLRVLEACKLSHKRDRRYQFWQEGNHPQQILGRNMMIQKVQYIHANPLKCGLVEAAEDWVLSSARNYLGRPGVLEVVRCC